MEKRKNFSRKREAILSALRGATCHPTAEWVYQQLKPVFPDLSLGTVYRNLSQFKNDGMIFSVGVVNGQERFDGNTTPHTHFICSGCGAVIDIEGDFLDASAEASVSRRYQFQVTSSELVFRGLCSHCQKSH